MSDPEQKDSVAFLLAEILRELRRSNNANAAPGPVREILTLEEVADYLRLSPNTLRDKVRLRQIPFHKVGGSIRFRRSKIDRWINQGEIAMIE